MCIVTTFLYRICTRHYVPRPCTRIIVPSSMHSSLCSSSMYSYYCSIVHALVTMFLVHVLVLSPRIVHALVTMFLVHVLVLLFHRPCTRHYVPRPCTRISSSTRVINCIRCTHELMTDQKISRCSKKEGCFVN
jgi:hypothetical protein